jgi:hypothetical protein
MQQKGFKYTAAASAAPGMAQPRGEEPAAAQGQVYCGRNLRRRRRNARVTLRVETVVVLRVDGGSAEANRGASLHSLPFRRFAMNRAAASIARNHTHTAAMLRTA